jgi:AAA family ATPase
LEKIAHENSARAENIFPGMAFELSLKGPKRAFRVTSVMSGEDKCTLGLFGESSTAQIKGGGWAVVETFTKPPPSAPLVIADFSGIDKALEKLNGFLAFVAQDRISGMRVQPCGVLIHGSPGTGKTLILQKLAETRWGKVFRIDRSMKLSNIKDIFTQAVSEKPSMILIDDLDVMVAREHSQASAVETALCDAMATLIPYVLVAATASSLTDVPRTLRKAGKFEVDILLSVPGADDRKEILKSISPLLAKNSALLEHVVDQTHAYTAEDLQLLLNEVGRTASGRLRKSESKEADKQAPMLKEDIDQSLLLVRATAMHDVTLEPPKIHWDDIGGQNAVKKALRYAVETPRLVSHFINFYTITNISVP